MLCPLYHTQQTDGVWLLLINTDDDTRVPINLCVRVYGILSVVVCDMHSVYMRLLCNMARFLFLTYTVCVLLSFFRGKKATRGKAVRC